MTLRVHTARVSYGGADRLDITRKSAKGYGLAFAPSWSLLRRLLNVRDTADALRDAATLLDADALDVRGADLSARSLVRVLRLAEGLLEEEEAEEAELAEEDGDGEDGEDGEDGGGDGDSGGGRGEGGAGAEFPDLPTIR